MRPPAPAASAQCEAFGGNPPVCSAYIKCVVARDVALSRRPLLLRPIGAALLQEKPHIVQEQKKGRALWWDRKLDLENLKRTGESNVKQQAYVYQNKV